VHGNKGVIEVFNKDEVLVCPFRGRKQEFEPEKRQGSWIGYIGGYIEAYLFIGDNTLQLRIKLLSSKTKKPLNL